MVLLPPRVGVPGWEWAATGLVAAGIITEAVITLLMLAGRATLCAAGCRHPSGLGRGVRVDDRRRFVRGECGTIPRWVAVFAYVLAIGLALGGAIVTIAFALPEP